MSKCRGTGTRLGRGVRANFFIEAVSGLGTSNKRRQAQAARNC